jgi:ferredoxin-NADP reductase
MIATRMRDTAFKRVLRKLPIGLKVRIDGPTGSFLLHRKAEKPAIFLAGGIGITPFLSIVRQATHEKLPHQMYLFYSNRRPEDTPFLDLLSETAKQNQNLHFIPTMTGIGKSHREWNGETGSINKDMLAKHLPAMQGGIYYIAGPPAMVGALRSMLIDAAVDEDDVRWEDFSGY